MLNTFWRISTPTKTITQPTHWFLGDLQLPGAAAKKHLELKSAKAEEIRSWERKWREAGPDGWPEDGRIIKVGSQRGGLESESMFFLERFFFGKKNGWMGVVCFGFVFHQIAIMWFIYFFLALFSWHGIFKKCWCAFCVFMNPNHIKVCLSNTMWNP